MQRTALAFAVFILLLAAALRIPRLAELPPGPHYDEAANLIITRTVAFGGARYFPMVENYQGREVLYYYLSAPFLALVHDGRFSLQLVSVFSNLLTVACAMALGRLMFPGRRGALIGLAAGVIAAVSLPQVLLARQAFRAITLPMMQGLALVFLWRGLRARAGGWGWLVAGGLIAGATVYTYNSSRLFPVWLAIGGLALLAFDGGQRWRRLRQGAAFFLPLVAVALPFAVYAVQEPDIFFGRLYEVTGGENEITLVHSIWLHARMFFLEGEALLRYNPPGRPYFTRIEGALLLLGTGTAVLLLLRRHSPPLERTACVLLLLSPLMIVPSVISTSGLPPNHMRSIAMVPLVFLLGGLGYQKLSTWLIGNAAAYATLAALLLFGTAFTAADYFAWASRADLYYDTDADLAAAATWTLENVPADETVYVAAQDRNHPTVSVFNLPNVRWLGTDTLFLPSEGSATVIFPRSAPPPEDWQGWLAEVGAATPDMPQAPDEQPAFQVVRLGSSVPLPPKLSAVEARTVTTAGAAAPDVRNESIRLLADFSDIALPAGRVAVVTGWEVLQTPDDDDLTPIVQLEDELGNVIARAESFSVGTRAWQQGETLIQRVPGLRVPIGTPPGIYRVKMAWVARGTERYLAYSDAQGAFAGIWAEVGQVEVLRPNTFPDASDLNVGVPANIYLDNGGITLLGWQSFPLSLFPGEVLQSILHWQAYPGATRHTMSYQFVLIGEAGTIELETDAPMMEKHPPSSWIDGQLMTDRARAYLPRDIAPGRYQLAIRADVANASSTTVELGTIQIEQLERRFTPPSASQSADVTFGDTLRLQGYTLEQATNALHISLVWQSATSTEINYKVFVHIVDKNGIIIAQQDAMPQSNTYPTSLWLDGEYVMDEYTFPNITDFHEIRVGLYVPETGTRLRTQNGVDHVLLVK